MKYPNVYTRNPKAGGDSQPYLFHLLVFLLEQREAKIHVWKGSTLKPLDHGNEAFPLLDRALSTRLEKILKPYQ